eukprot:13319769-Ditylum_brightwellii.AAC.1
MSVEAKYMQVGIFCLTSVSTCGLAIQEGKAVMFALVTQAQQPTWKKNTPFFLSVGRRQSSLVQLGFCMEV